MAYAEVDFDEADDGGFKGTIITGGDGDTDSVLTSTDQRTRVSVVRNSVSLSESDSTFTVVSELGVKAISVDPADIYADVEVMRKRKMTSSCSTGGDDLTPSTAAELRDYDEVEARTSSQGSQGSGVSPADEASLMTSEERVHLQSVSSNNRNNLLQRRLHTKKVTINETPEVDLKRLRNFRNSSYNERIKYCYKTLFNYIR